GRKCAFSRTAHRARAYEWMARPFDNLLEDARETAHPARPAAALPTMSQNVPKCPVSAEKNGGWEVQWATLKCPRDETQTRRGRPRGRPVDHLGGVEQRDVGAG